MFSAAAMEKEFDELTESVIVTSVCIHKFRQNMMLNQQNNVVKHVKHNMSNNSLPFILASL